jgi:hypothetical protein
MLEKWLKSGLACIVSMPVFAVCEAIPDAQGLSGRARAVWCASVAQMGIACLVAGFSLVAWCSIGAEMVLGHTSKFIFSSVDTLLGY